MTKKLTVLVDMDGVLNDFHYHFLTYMQTKTGCNYNQKAMEDYRIWPGIEHVKAKKVFNSIMEDDNFWLTLPSLNQSDNGLGFLSIHYDTWIATSPWNEKNKKIKERWLSEVFPFFDVNKVIYSDAKWNIETKHHPVIIEDKSETIQTCNEKGFITIKMLHPYNRDTHADFTMTSWDSIISLMNKVEGVI